MLIAKLKSLQLSQLYTTLHKEGRCAATMQSVHKTLVNAFNEAVNVPKIHFHDLRHTHASLLLGLNVNIKVVSERLGHVINRYNHSLPTMQKEASNMFDQFIYATQK